MDDHVFWTIRVKKEGSYAWEYWKKRGRSKRPMKFKSKAHAIQYCAEKSKKFTYFKFEVVRFDTWT